MDREATERPFFGRLVNRQDVAGLTLADSVYAPGLRLPRHGHGSAYFCFVLRGSYTEEYEHCTRTCMSESVVVHPEGESHSDRFHESGARIFNVAFSPRWAARVRELSAVLDRPAAFQGGAIAWLASRLYQEVRAADAVSPLAVEGLTLEILGQASRQPDLPRKGLPRWLRPVLEFVQARFADGVRLDEVAREAGVHPLHLARVFRRELGCSIGEYVRRLRVDLAGRHLAASDMPLAEVALATGFSDQSHFSRTFRRYCGMTPSQFRRVRRPR
jgi:AraC family transcriptional regulator